MLYSLAKLGMYLAVSFLCGLYMFHRRRELVTNNEHVAKLLLLVFAHDHGRLVCGSVTDRTDSVAAVQHDGDAAVQPGNCPVLAAAVALLTQLTLGHELSDLVTVLACISVPVLLLRRVRSRTKLIYVASVDCRGDGGHGDWRGNPDGPVAGSGSGP